jgi:hypothetical protein
MDTTQLLFSTAVTITTVLLILVSLQLISLLKQLKKNAEKDHNTKKSDNLLHQSADSGKKEKIIKKKANLTSLLDKIKILIPPDHSHKKKFFKAI